MYYECVDARFLFFNGKDRYTVEYAYALSTWFVFKDEMRTDALWKKINPESPRIIHRWKAESILEEYLDTLPQPTTTDKQSQ